MSDRESQQASIDASGAPIPAENDSWEVEYAPLPPLGSEETGGSDAGVAARTRLQVRLQYAGEDILDPARIAAPQARSDPTTDPTHADSNHPPPFWVSVSFWGFWGFPSLV